MKITWRKILVTWKEGAGKCCTTLAKDSFPVLLKQLDDKMKENGAENLKSGFRKTGIVPLDRTQVLNRLPNNTTTYSPHRANHNVSQSFVEFLNNIRSNDTPTIRRVRRKLVVPAGKSVTSDEIHETAIASGSAATASGSGIVRKVKTNTKPFERNNIIDSSDDSSQPSQMDVECSSLEGDVDENNNEEGDM